METQLASCPIMTNKQIPEGWGNDSLSAFIELANRNTFGAFVQYNDWFTRLQKIDAAFGTFSENLLNTSVFYEPFLFVRAHSSYRAAIRLATSGQMPEAFSILRNCLEYALYGFYLNKFPAEIQTWAARDDSEAGKKKACRELKFGKMLSHLDESSSATGKAARHLYELTIDSGAHPNRKTITLAMKREETNEHVSFDLAQLNNDPIMFTMVLKTCAQVGICSLKIFNLVFPERFDLLGISDEIEQLSKKKVGGIPL
jgi:hypothetical protein